MAPAPRANPELRGQDAAVAVLRTAARSGRLPHGWLLTGPPGIGKATLAFRFARALLADPEASDPDLAVDPAHPVFRQVAQGSHPDLRVVEAPRDPKTGKLKAEITVDLVRAATASLNTTAAQGGRRIVVIDGAESLNRNAANALLKSLEEPPPGAVLLLVSHQPGRVAPTLRSRCAKLALARLPDAEVAAALARHAPDLPAGQRDALAQLARGSIGRALELAGGDWLSLYHRLATGLAGMPPDRLALHALAGELSRYADARSFAAPFWLIQELLGRVVGAAIGRHAPALFEGEPEALARLAAGRPLDRWGSLWEKVARLASAVDGLNLDRRQALLHILTLLALLSEKDQGAGSALGDLDGG
ncbi:MAG TPA: DNA polymerase III subunit delta' [Geminicoccaceae bacterium]|nr:DNA polymerase III subunit delta' [Geminicoccaceae bacterium]